MSTPGARALERRVLRYIKTHDLMSAGDNVIVGVSGGADSTALLLLLATLASKLGIEIRAACFDHQLRGKIASERERRTVVALAEKLRVPLTCGAGDVRAYAREKRAGIEEAARELRYAFLARTARECGALRVAVGHTADDQVETVLMHILRGSGLGGLAGMAPRSPWPLSDANPADLMLVRPLLEVRRSETEEYCRDAGYEPLRDSSNRSLRYRRNVVRYQLLPFMRQHVPGLDDSLMRLARAAASERRFIEAAVAPILSRATGENRLMRLPITELRNVPSELLPVVMQMAASRLLGDARDLGERHLLAMSAAVAKPTGTSLDLSRGLRLSVGYEEIVLSTKGWGKELEALPLEGVEVAVPGVTEVARWRIETSTTKSDGRSSAKGGMEARMDGDRVRGRVVVRRRHTGDHYQPLGLAGEKKLQDVFVDAKVPRWQRDSVPVVCDEEGIVWCAGHRIAERVRVRETTRRVLWLRADSI